MSEEQSQSVQNQPKEYVERPMVEKPISTEVATESQEAPIESPDFGQLIQDSKKYRKRAQESELALDKLNKKIESSRQKQLEEQNEWQTLAEERFTRLQEIEPMVEQFQKEEANQREMILADLTESDREVFGDLPLPKLRVLHSKLINNDKSVASTSGTPARSVNPSNKNWTEMSQDERRSNWKDIVQSYSKVK
tara:strand:- start:2479 stop:3060 length:582 start_codon:yes stop_codon:yes gene_type:complete